MKVTKSLAFGAGLAIGIIGLLVGVAILLVNLLIFRKEEESPNEN